VPVVSAVGHEIDTSLTDLAADARAATPSQAAEMLVPDAEARRAELAHVEARLCHTIGHRLRAARVELEGLPIERAAERFLAERRAAIGRLDRRLAERHPRAVIAAAQAELGPLEVRLEAAARRHIEAMRRRFAGDVARLSAMSPLEVLARGYAIATNEAGRAVRHARDVSPGDRIAVRVHEGALLATVVATAGPGEPLPSGGGSGSGSGSGRGSGRGGRRSASEQLGLALAPERRGADG
jgi:exodeoxyribonuclease VII large subunit